MGDDQDRALGSRQDRPVGADVPSDRAAPAFAAARRFDGRLVRRGPLAVGRERAAFEAAEADVFQLSENQPRDVAAGERQVGRLPGALELARHAEVELGVGEQLSEPPRLLPPRGRQGAGAGGLAVVGSDNAARALAQAGEAHLVHLACFRSSAVASRRMKRAT